MRRLRSTKSWAVLGLVVALGLAGLAGFFLKSGRGVDPVREGFAGYERGDWQAAALAARKALREKPPDPKAVKLLARASARLGREAEAVAIYRRIGLGSMEPEDFYLLGRAFLRDGKSGPAAISFRSALSADPNHAESLDETARFQAAQGQLFEAAELAERLLKQDGWGARGRVLLAGLRHRLHDPKAAIDELETARRLDPALRGASLTQAQTVSLLVSCLLEDDHVDEADRLLDAEGGILKATERAWLLSRIRLRQGRVADAESAVQQSEGLSDDEPMRPEPSAFAGAAACASCHARNHGWQQNSRHARSLVRTPDLAALEWPVKPLVDPDNPSVRHEFHRDGDDVKLATTIDQRAFQAIVLYAMGSNHQGRSFLGRDEGGMVRELRVSQYPVEPSWGRTNQHTARPSDEREYLGRALPAASFAECLDCHATHSLAVTEPAGRPEATDHGIGCERCHGPGGNHILAVNAKLTDLAIARPRLASAAQVMELCNQCHRSPPLSPEDEPGFIRFQSPNVLKSRCYTESEGGLTCVSCHNPHRDASHDTKQYESICLQCHPAPGHSSATEGTDRKTWSPCPTSPERGCLECHMPKVTDAVPRSVFTDHHIRIRKPAQRTVP